jgi:DNA (cytosine-5)-methyltransferase 1
MIRAGFRVLAAVDFNKEAVATARENLGVPEIGGQPRHVDSPIPHVLAQDLTTFGPKDLAELIGYDHVDVIVGGPPCQGFSSARQRDGANHGEKRFVEDERRHLYQEFLKYVAHFRPRVFVMENVLGIRSAAGGEYYTRVLHEARRLGYRVQSQVEDAYRLGVPQKRRRQLFIGVRAKPMPITNPL